MDFDLTDAQRMIRDLARELAENEVKPLAAEIDRTGQHVGRSTRWGGRVHGSGRG